MSVFRFRHFEVRQESSAMKVGTDAMVLGALVQSENPSTILDIGTGTGVLALMMAQKFSKAQILAIEIEPSAADEAKINVANSPWSERINVFQSDLKDWVEEQKFELIISNPPFYTDGLLNPNPHRAQARHVFSLPFDLLFSKVANLLQIDGAFWMIAPYADIEMIFAEAQKVNLWPTKHIEIFGKRDGTAIRAILSFSLDKEKSVEIDQLTIRELDGAYTAEYIAWTIDFHGVAI
jgi:tRNA1Val (adenine37-N6)-methyltransferase